MQGHQECRDIMYMRTLQLILLHSNYDKFNYVLLKCKAKTIKSKTVSTETSIFPVRLQTSPTQFQWFCHHFSENSEIVQKTFLNCGQQLIFLGYRQWSYTTTYPVSCKYIQRSSNQRVSKKSKLLISLSEFLFNTAFVDSIFSLQPQPSSY